MPRPHPRWVMAALPSSTPSLLQATAPHMNLVQLVSTVTSSTVMQWLFVFMVTCLSGSLPQVFLTSLPPVAAQIPVSAVQLHPVTEYYCSTLTVVVLWTDCNVTVPQMVISQQSSSSSNLTELQVVSLDVHQSKED